MTCFVFGRLYLREMHNKEGAVRDVGGLGGFMRSVVHREPTVSLPQVQSMSISAVNPYLALPFTLVQPNDPCYHFQCLFGSSPSLSIYGQFHQLIMVFRRDVSLDRLK